MRRSRRAERARAPGHARFRSQRPSPDFAFLHLAAVALPRRTPPPTRRSAYPSRRTRPPPARRRPPSAGMRPPPRPARVSCRNDLSFTISQRSSFRASMSSPAPERASLRKDASCKPSRRAFFARSTRSTSCAVVFVAKSPREPRKHTQPAPPPPWHTRCPLASHHARAPLPCEGPAHARRVRRTRRV